MDDIADNRPIFVMGCPVAIVRDGRDCVASLKEMPWQRHRDVASLAAQWAYNVDCGRRAGRRLPADTYHELRHEDLVAEPAATLGSLCEFLGERFEPAMTQPTRIATLAVPRQKTSQERTWRGRLTPDEIVFCESVLAGRLRQHGYPVTTTRLPVRRRLDYVVPDASRRARLARQAVLDLLRM